MRNTEYFLPHNGQCPFKKALFSYWCIPLQRVFAQLSQAILELIFTEFNWNITSFLLSEYPKNDLNTEWLEQLIILRVWMINIKTASKYRRWKWMVEIKRIMGAAKKFSSPKCWLAQNTSNRWGEIFRKLNSFQYISFTDICLLSTFIDFQSITSHC